MKQNQLLVLIFILYCIEQYKFSVSCTKFDSVNPSTSLKDDHSDVYSDQKDSKYSVRSERELTRTNVYTNANDLTKEDRASRKLSGSRRHLKVGDANQVANYFLTGGPLKGHSHFTGAADCNSKNDETNNDQTNIVGISDQINETNPSANEESFNTNLSDSIVGAAHIPALHSVPRIAPAVQPYALYNPTATRFNPMLHPTLNPLTTIPHVPLKNSLLRSILHPRLHPHINRLHSIPTSLARAASLPLHSLLQAQSELHHTLLPTSPLHPSLYKPLLRNANTLLPYGITEHPVSGLINQYSPTHLINQYSPTVGMSPRDFKSKDPSMIHPNFLTHFPLAGYIVKYVPHTKALQSSPVVGSPQQPSAPTDDNSNAEQNIVGSVHNQDENTNDKQADGAQDENCKSK